MPTPVAVNGTGKTKSSPGAYAGEIAPSQTTGQGIGMMGMIIISIVVMVVFHCFLG